MVHGHTDIEGARADPGQLDRAPGPSAIVPADFFSIDTVFLKRLYILRNPHHHGAPDSLPLSSSKPREVVH
jgi:hypothetical protein